LEGLNDELDKEKKLPQMLHAFKLNVFDKVRKFAEHIGPGGNLHIGYQ